MSLPHRTRPAIAEAIRSRASVPLAFRQAWTGAIFAALALFIMAGASAAEAADCVNGYRTLGNGVILLCDDAAAEPRAFFDEEADAGVPLAPAAARPRGLMADGIENCAPGLYRMMEWENGSMLLACR
jgi:hypothetical protein